MDRNATHCLRNQRLQSFFKNSPRSSSSPLFSSPKRVVNSSYDARSRSSRSYPNNITSVTNNNAEVSSRTSNQTLDNQSRKPPATRKQGSSEISSDSTTGIAKKLASSIDTKKILRAAADTISTAKSIITFSRDKPSAPSSGTKIMSEAYRKGEQITWEARRSAISLGKRMRDSTAHFANDAKETAQDKLKERLSHSNYSFKSSLPALPSLSSLLSRTASNMKDKFTNRITSTTKELSTRITSNISEKTRQTKETIVKSVFTGAERVSGDLKSMVGNAMRWLWWWGLAAVGVYGVSTTVTQEGMRYLKDAVAPSSSHQLQTPSSSDELQQHQNEDECGNDQENIDGDKTLISIWNRWWK